MPYDSKKIRTAKQQEEIIQIVQELFDILKDAKITPQEEQGFLTKIRKLFR